ncbi:MAG: universal stress protein [Proteobacteria bacterium]|nr:universal stress protein [Pseudomonadota bacterium]
MSERNACLVVADESKEFPAALTYAGQLAKVNGWRLIMLRVIEPSDPAPWASITEEMRRQAHDAAESLTQRFAAEVWAECGITAEPVLRDGSTKQELKKLVDEDASIKLVVLAAAHGTASGPGPLVQSLAKSAGLSTRHIAVMVIPGTLSREEIRALAVPIPVAPPESDAASAASPPA